MLDDRRNAKLVDFGAAREGAHVMLHSVQVRATSSPPGLTLTPTLTRRFSSNTLTPTPTLTRALPPSWRRR